MIIPTKTIKLIALVVVGFLVVRWLMSKRKAGGAPYTKEGTQVTAAPEGIWV